jgi:hypothetical protein
MKLHEFRIAIESMYQSCMVNGVIDMAAFAVVVQVDDLPYDPKWGLNTFLQARKPIIVVRINPNGYRTNGSLVIGCYRMNTAINKLRLRAAQFERRFGTSIAAIDRALELVVPERNITVVELFFDGYL